MITYRNVIVTRSKEIINVGQTKALSSTKARPKLERGSKLDQGLSEALTRLVQSSNEARPNAATFEKKLSKLWRLLPKPPPLEIWYPPLSQLSELIKYLTIESFIADHNFVRKAPNEVYSSSLFLLAVMIQSPFLQAWAYNRLYFFGHHGLPPFYSAFYGRQHCWGYFSSFRSPLHLLKYV